MAGNQEPRHRRRRSGRGRRCRARRRPSRAGFDALKRQCAADSALEDDHRVEEVSEDQIACADLIVLNKSDLLDDDGINAALTAISRALPRSVKVLTVTDGKVDEALLLGLGVGTEEDIANRRTRHDAEAEHDHDDFD